MSNNSWTTFWLLMDTWNKLGGKGMSNGIYSTCHDILFHISRLKLMSWQLHTFIHHSIHPLDMCVCKYVSGKDLCTHLLLPLILSVSLPLHIVQQHSLVVIKRGVRTSRGLILYWREQFVRQIGYEESNNTIFPSHKLRDGRDREPEKRSETRKKFVRDEKSWMCVVKEKVVHIVPNLFFPFSEKVSLPFDCISWGRERNSLCM